MVPYTIQLTLRSHPLRIWKRSILWLQWAHLSKITLAIRKDFTFYDTPLVQQIDCYLYRWWYKFQTIAGIVQRLYQLTNNIGYPSDTYDMDMKLTILELHSAYGPYPSFWDVSRFTVCVPFPAPFCWTTITDLQQTQQENRYFSQSGLLNLNFPFCSQQDQGVRWNEVIGH